MAKKIEPKQYRRLPVKLALDQISKRAEKLAAVLQEREHIVGEKREVGARYGTRIKTLDSEVADLAKTIATGSEEQDVEVIEKPNFTEGMMETTRIDLDEIIFSRPLCNDERQGVIEEKPTTVVRKAPGKNAGPVAAAAAGNLTEDK